jgi:TPR repeat protein
MNAQIIEFYRQLDVEPGADLVSIRQSYHQLVKVWHPDRFGNDKKLQAVANDKLKKINFAYESLVAFIENGGKNEPSPPPKAEAPPRNTKASSAEGIYRSGLDRYKSRDYKEAVRFFQQAAGLGDAKSQYALGFMLYHHAARNFFYYSQGLC